MFERLFLRVRVIFFLISLTGISMFSLATEQSVNVKPPADWVLQRQVDLHSDIPLNDLSDGTYYRLLDNQIKIEQAGERSQYSRYIETIVNKAGLEKSSQLNFYYDPSYQTFVLHHLFIYRDGKKIDKLKTAKISIFSQENDLKTQIYHGGLTVNILLDDLREGDTLDYSYSRLGSNPVYSNIFSYDRNLTWSVPVNHQFIRVLWGKDKPLYVNTRNISPHIQKIKQADHIEYQVAVHNAQHVQLASQTPRWYDPYGHIYFSETADWQSVIQWAAPLYKIQALHPDIQAIANDIKQITTDKKQQISKALTYTQNEIRYVGLEMGTNSHFPTPAHETVALRYGDCKDKALLLISILNALDITAYPALVNTDDTKLLEETPPGLHYFDHVIVTLEQGGKRYWLDPTMNYQQGLLDNIFQPDFAYALILHKNSSSLTSMSATKINSFSEIIEKYVLADDPQATAGFSVESRFLGNKAQQKLNQIAQDGIKALTEAYEIYYQSYHSKLKSLAEVTVAPNPYSGILTLNEHYQINNIWTKADDGYEIDFYPHDVREAIYKPKQVVRNSPLAFNYPNNIKNTIVITFSEDGWHFDNKKVSEDNAFFSYHSKVDFENNTLTLSYDFQAKTDHIPADKIDDYLAARKRVMADAYYGVIKYYEEESLLDKLNNYVETQASQKRIEEKLATSADNTIVIKVSDKANNDVNISAAASKAPLDMTESEYVGDDEHFDDSTKLKSSAQLDNTNKKQWDDYWLFMFIVFYLLAYLFILVNWRKEAKNNDQNCTFYAVSLFKFMCLSIASFGLYNHYWLYRNWQCIKASQQLNIMPFYRSVFAFLWFYPLYLTLKKDSDNKYQKNLVARSPIVMVMALLYSLLLIFSIYLDLFYSLLILAITGFLFIPLVDYIWQHGAIEQHERKVNDTWQFRHSLLMLLFCPLILMSAAQHYYLIPKNQIVEGKLLKASDIKFLKQNAILPIKDDLVYFYSDAWFSIQNSGVGFSQSMVFSYGYTIDGRFYKSLIPFEEISKIEVDFARSANAYTSLLLTEKSGNKVVLMVSAQKQQDKTFVKRLKARWQAVYFAK